MTQCEPELPPLLLAGIAQFNAGEYFECHETLEALWKAEHRPVRELYQGILQLAVALYHLQRGNYRGTLNLLRGARAHLAPFAPACQRVDVAGLLAAADAIEQAVRHLGPERLSQFDRALIPRVRLITAPAS
ncbi:MAG: DUF309 domain-containing protein [Chloroflexi bacterium]|nr:DUF309 domain-containing protein [Chloroflexota bacterium]